MEQIFIELVKALSSQPALLLLALVLSGVGYLGFQSIKILGKFLIDVNESQKDSEKHSIIVDSKLENHEQRLEKLEDKDGDDSRK